jgi:hypothetical protein
VEGVGEGPSGHSRAGGNRAGCIIGARMLQVYSISPWVNASGY